MVKHASLHRDTVSAAQIATGFLPHFPGIELLLSVTALFQEIEKEKKRKANSTGALEGMVSFLCSVHKINLFHFLSRCLQVPFNMAAIRNKYVTQLLVHPDHRPIK